MRFRDRESDGRRERRVRCDGFSFVVGKIWKGDLR